MEIMLDSAIFASCKRSPMSLDIKSNLGVEEAEIEKLFKQYYPRLHAYALRFVEDDSTADDIVQECFMKLYEKRISFNDVSLSSLLFVMVRNSCIDYLRHKTAVKFESFQYLASIEGEEKLYNIDFAFTPHDQLVYEELKQEIERVVDSLPPKCREVFLLSRFEGLKNREIAEKLQMSLGNVEKHISKAIAVFSRHFRANYGEEAYIVLLAWLLGSYL